MYYPILRGRQFELLALRECVEKQLLSSKLIPIIEPVKLSSTLLKTIDAFMAQGKALALIVNPQVGELKSSADLQGVISEEQEQYVIKVIYADRKIQENLKALQQRGETLDRLYVLLENPNMISDYENAFSHTPPALTFIPDKGLFRNRIRGAKVLCEDHFPKQARNADYAKTHTNFFSADHCVYKEDRYAGFSDYSVIGKEYSETGFAPFAVAIHIVYFDSAKNLQIEHFVSDSNEGIADPAGKFAEAVGKLVEWNRAQKLDTVGVQSLEDFYRNGTYPGLGVVKKCSIMHHMELMSRFLEGKVK